MKTNTLDQTHYTTAQAAEKLGKTTGRIRQLARAGELEGEVFGTGYLFPRSVIDKRARGAAATDDSPRKERIKSKPVRSRKHKPKRGAKARRR